MSIRTTRALSSLPALAATAALLLSACAARHSESSSASESGGAALPTVSPVAAQEGGQPLAVIDGKPITLADLQEIIGDQLATLEVSYGAQRSQLLQQGLQEVIRQRLLEAAAAEQGVGVQELLAQRVGIVQVGDDEVRDWYEANKTRLQGRPVEMLQPAIRQFLIEQRQEAIIEEIVAEIAEDRAVEVLLEPFRVTVDVDGHPSTGPQDAPVVLVEFSDFECPYCGGFVGTLERVKAAYAGKIRLVYRQFPLTQIHPNAMPAAHASLCAEEQGKFWELHDVMFAEQQRLGEDDLKEKARRVGMDGAAFDACLASGKYQDQIEADMKLGERLGVSGTPAMFVNGIPLDAGAVPYEALAKVIDEELERLAR